MVLIWNDLARGDPEYCAILVAMNSILQILLYSPLALFFLVTISNQYTGADGFHLQFLDVFESVLLFLGVPLAAALLTRYAVIWYAGVDWLQKEFNPRVGPIALLALLWTTFAIFAIQGKNIIDNIGPVCRVAVPMTMYFFLMFTCSFLICRELKFGYEKSVTQAFTASSNNFELAIAVAAGTFGVDSPEALAATIGPLVEVPVLLGLVYVALWLKPQLDWGPVLSSVEGHLGDDKRPSDRDREQRGPETFSPLSPLDEYEKEKVNGIEIPPCDSDSPCV
jgi:arsenite transporter